MSIHGYVGNIITANPTAPTVSSASGVWTTEQQLAAKSAGNWPFTIPTQQISRSLRFNSADSPSLTRTPSSSGSQTTFTHSMWVKRTALSSASFKTLYGSESTGSNYVNCAFYQDTIYWTTYNGTTNITMQTTQVFRDVSSWYHIVIAVDTTQATASNRVKIYVNGSQITAGTFNYPTLNQALQINTASFTHKIGFSAGFSQYFDGYMAEIYFVDGQALTPSSFGQINAGTGVWEPIAYTGTYGTNGFYLNFSDNSGTTSTTLGKDTSGNGNNLTPNNFSVTAGVGNDSMVDTPTSYGTDTGVGGEVRGNYATLNPLKRFTANVTLSNGNLTASDGSTTSTCAIATINLPTSGKWYWEVTVSASVASGIFIGACPEANAYGTAVVQTNGSYRNNGTIYNTAGATQTSGATYTTNDVIGVAVDVDNGTVQFYKNGVAQGATPSFSFTALSVLVPFVATDNASGTKTVNCNFGQTSFLKWNGSAFVANTAPSGFKALCTTNLPTPTIGATSTTQAGKYFNPILYTGDGTAPKSFTGVGFQPDLVWIKARSAAYWHHLTDAVRGVNKSLYSNTTDAEATSNAVSAFGTDGFTINNTDVNGSGVTYVAWNWNAGGSNATNTSGTITSTVRANTTSGFSIVTYTGNGTNGATVGHGLGVAPSMIIVKKRSTGTAGNWLVYHTSTGINQYLYLNSTAAAATSSPTWGVSSTLITLQQPFNDYNTSTAPYVAYCFAPVAGYSAFGSYTGNGSSDGPFIFTNFRPRFVMFKRTDATSNWLIIDAARSPYNQTNEVLLPNSSSAEGTGAGYGAYDFLSNGFKPRNVVANETNVSGGTYIYAAFAEFPFKYSLAR